MENKSLTLYHGSKSGINGKIKPCSRKECDFGKGFYAGTISSQPLTLICNYPNAKLYELQCDLTNLNILNMDMNIDWAMLIAYNRGKLDNFKNTKLYHKMQTLQARKDVIKGNIANDRMFVVLDRFFRGEITDKALLHSLSALKLGEQYAFLTEKACNKIHILRQQSISPEERKKIQLQSERQRKEGIKLADQICKEYRREGLFFDEIIEAEN